VFEQAMWQMKAFFGMVTSFMSQHCMSAVRNSVSDICNRADFSVRDRTVKPLTSGFSR